MKQISRRDFVRSSMATSAAVATAAGPSTASEAAAASKEKMKIVGICCSCRKGKTTATSLQVSLESAQEVSSRIEAELIELAGLKINGNIAAGAAPEPGQRDDFPPLVPRLANPKVRGIIIGTPVYFGTMSSLCKAFLDRCIVLWQDDLALSGKVAGALAVGGSRNGGQEVTIQSVQTSLFCQEMIVVGNGRPGPRLGATVWSGAPGGVTKDEYGMTTAKGLGRRVAEVVMQLSGSHA